MSGRRFVMSCLMFISLFIPMIVFMHTAWFMYVTPLPDMVTIKLLTKPTCIITIIGVLSTLINFNLMLYTLDNIKKT